jgi:hypothetical protein
VAGGTEIVGGPRVTERVAENASPAREQLSTSEATRAALAARFNSVEECYELTLAYAAQGLASDMGSPLGSQIRDQLRRCEAALAGLADLLTDYVAQTGLQPVDPYSAFISVIDRDARSAQAVVQLVLAQPFISSQLIDNLNASIHVRSLLTDIFLVDEILKTTPQA